MELAEGIYYTLSNSTVVTPLVSTRIYPGTAPQDAALPYLVFYQVDRTPVRAMQNDAALEGVNYQISTWSTSYGNSRTISAAVEMVLKDYSGTMGNSSTITIQRAFFDDEVEYVTIDPETKKANYHVAQRYLFWVGE